MNRITSAIRTSVLALLGRQLPERTKRLIFVTSLSARLKNSTSLDNETLNKLNKVMVLCNSESAMELPVLLSKIIWRGKTTTEICHEQISWSILSRDSIQNIAGAVTSGMPSWLRYGNESNMQVDVQRLLDNKRAVLGI